MVGTTVVVAGLVERIVLVTTLLTAAAAAETYPILDLLLVAHGRHMARAVSMNLEKAPHCRARHNF